MDRSPERVALAVLLLPIAFLLLLGCEVELEVGIGSRANSGPPAARVDLSIPVVEVAGRRESIVLPFLDRFRRVLRVRRSTEHEVVTLP